MSPRLRIAIEDLEGAMATLRHQSQANAATIHLTAANGMVHKSSIIATLKHQIDTTAAALEKLQAVRDLLAAESKDES